MGCFGDCIKIVDSITGNKACLGKTNFIVLENFIKNYEIALD
jgi:hypothetical protein